MASGTLCRLFRLAPLAQEHAFLFPPRFACPGSSFPFSPEFTVHRLDGPQLIHPSPPEGRLVPSQFCGQEEAAVNTVCRLLCGCGRGCSAPLGKCRGGGGARRPGGRARVHPVPSETSKPSPSEAAPPAFPATAGELPAAPGPPVAAGVRALDVSGSGGCAVEPPAAVFFTCVFKQLLGLSLAQTWQIKFWTFIPLTDIPDNLSLIHI